MHGVMTLDSCNPNRQSLKNQSLASLLIATNTISIKIELNISNTSTYFKNKI